MEVAFSLMTLYCILMTLLIVCALLFQSSSPDVSGDVEEVKAEEDEVWDTMETVTEKTKKRAAQKAETAVNVDGKKKRKLVKTNVK